MSYIRLDCTLDAVGTAAARVIILGGAVSFVRTCVPCYALLGHVVGAAGEDGPVALDRGPAARAAAPPHPHRHSDRAGRGAQKALVRGPPHAEPRGARELALPHHRHRDGVRPLLHVCHAGPAAGDPGPRCRAVGEAGAEVGGRMAQAEAGRDRDAAGRRGSRGSEEGLPPADPPPPHTHTVSGVVGGGGRGGEGGQNPFPPSSPASIRHPTRLPASPVGTEQN